MKRDRNAMECKNAAFFFRLAITLISVVYASKVSYLFLGRLIASGIIKKPAFSF